ncbi:MAG: aminotransferase class V-fold PLP-dependent enzyme [Dinoroseobacter sp.]|nr:aminotransferase class V-fold PLP-dependent enzyme [Dinoroseobacter sp.]
MALDLDLEFVRAQFPAFQEPSLEGWAFFENAGGSYPCRQVTERLERFYRERKVQPYSAYPASTVAGEEMDEARRRLAAMLNVEGNELSFGPSTTTNTYVLSQAFRQLLDAGEAIIVTNQDHEANTGPWRRLAEEGIEVREWQMNSETGELDLNDLENLLDEKVRLVCFPHCSNVIGAINPVSDIVSRVHLAGAFACVDGVSYAPHGLPDVGSMGADIYLFSTYKTFGPHQGAMVIRRSLGEILPNQGHHFNGGTLYKRFTPSGPDHAQIAACAGIADYFDAYAEHHDLKDAHSVMNSIRSYEISLLQPILDAFSGRNDVRLIGPAHAENRAPTVALDLGRAAAPLEAELAQHKIMAGGGDFYAGRALSGVGVDPDQGVLRVSLVHYTSEDEVSRMIDAVNAVI